MKLNMAAKVNIDEVHTAVHLFKNMKFDLKQNIISCGLVTPLENISIAKIAVILWHHGIREELRKFDLACPSSNYLFLSTVLTIEEKVLEKVSCLMLPTHFEEMMKEKIKIIGSELESYFHTQSLDFLIFHKNKENLVVYFENLCWTQEGKINKLKTFENIIENSNLSLKDKYILSCNNCLNEKIQNLYKKLPGSIISDIFNDCEFDNEDAESFRLVKFWTFDFRGRSNSRIKLVNEDITYGDLLEWVIQKNMDVAFEYIWENFASETVKKHLINFLDLPNNNLCWPNNNCMLFLCNQRTHFELKDLLRVEIMEFVVITLDRISRYYNVGLVPAYLHAFIKTHNVWKSFELLIIIRRLNFLDSNAYVRIFEKFSLHFANDIRDNFSVICNKVLENFLDPKEGIQLFKYLLKIGTFPNKIKVLLDRNGTCLCVHILSESMETFEQFINDHFDSEEEISQFKTLFFAKPEINSIFCSSLLVNNYEFLEEMLTKFFSKDEASRYKNELPYKDDADILFRICNCSTKVDVLSTMDKFLSWCYEEDEDKTMKCKSRIFDLQTPLYMPLKGKLFRNIEYYISMSEWELVEKYWKWIFFATEDDISTLSKKLERIKKILHFESGVEPKSFAEFLKTFITLCFVQHEIDELKKELMDNKILLTFVREIIVKVELDNYSKAESLLDWCYSSDKEAIYKVKIKFFSIYGDEIMLKLIKFPNYIVAATNLFEWWKPSLESARLFQNIVNNKIRQSKLLYPGQLKICNLERKRLNECFKILRILAKKDMP